MSKKSSFDSLQNTAYASNAFRKAGRTRSAIKEKLAMHVRDYNARARAYERTITAT